jgi:RNA polymerase sigma-70 factor (sigma-E family)
MPATGTMTPLGQDQRFAEFVRAHWVELMQIAIGVCGSRADAEDLVQTALTNAYPRWGSIRPDQAMAYLRRAIVNTHISWWRRRHGSQAVELDVADTPGPDWAADADERQDTLVLLQGLPTKQRAVLLLQYISGLSTAETAQTLGIRESTVRSQSARALASLRTHLEGQASQPFGGVGSPPTQIAKRS